MIALGDASLVSCDFGADGRLLRGQEGFDQRTSPANGDVTESLEPIVNRHGRIAFNPMEDLHQILHRDTSPGDPIQKMAEQFRWKIRPLELGHGSGEPAGRNIRP